jgi:hypothetical protein
MDSEESLKRRHTGAKRVISTPELLAWRKIFAFSRNTLEVVRVVLEACVVRLGKSQIQQKRNPSLTNALFDWCLGSGLGGRKSL